MKYVENGGDVRSTSANPAYMGVVFQGTVDEAIAQAKAAPDHGVPELNGRAELLAFLRVVNTLDPFRDPRPFIAQMFEDLETEVARDSLVPATKPAQPWDKFSPFSLEYATARWPESFKQEIKS